MSSPTPKFLYKILDSPPQSPLPNTLPSTPLDTTDGFIHLSTLEQTPITARLFFSSYKQLWILRLDREKLELDGRMEYSTDPKAGVVDGCAHLHESQHGLGADNILSVVEVRRSEGEEWADAFRSVDLESS